MKNIFLTKPSIDLTRHAFVREMGDIRLYGTWLHDPVEDSDQPALVLVPAFRRWGFTPCVVPLASAYKYTDPRYLAAASLQFAKELGFGDSSLSAAHKIGDLVHGHLLDLIKMPENPTDIVVGAVAEIEHSDGSKRTIEILDHVNTAQI